MADITIVTAFFDIGRGNSRVGERIMPEYFIRSTDTYFEYFSHMAKLENDMVIFTTEEFKERILSLRKGYGNTNVVIFDFHNRLPLFSIEKKVKLNSYEDVLCFIFNNQVYLIGGCIIGTKEK